MNRSAHFGSGVVGCCRSRPSGAVLLRRLQLAASDPPRSPVGFERISGFAVLAIEHAPSFAAARKRQNRGGPAFGASQSLDLSHSIKMPLDLAASPFQIHAVRRNNSAHLYVGNGRQPLSTGKFGKWAFRNRREVPSAIRRLLGVFPKKGRRAPTAAWSLDPNSLRGADVA